MLMNYSHFAFMDYGAVIKTLEALQRAPYSVAGAWGWHNGGVRNNKVGRS